MNWELLLQLIVNGLIVGTLYGVVAMCFTLIYKASQVVNFAQGEFLLIGAWVCWWLLADLQLPFWAAFPMTLAFMMAFGILLQVVLLRPMIGEPIIGDHGDDRAVDLLSGGHEMDLRGHRAAVPADLRGRRGERPRPQCAAGLPAEPGRLARHHGRLRVVLQILALRPGHAGDGVQSAGGAEPRYLGTEDVRALLGDLGDGRRRLRQGVSSALSLFGIKVFPAVILGGLDSIVGAIVGGLIIGLLENLAEYVDGQWVNIGSLYNIAPFYVLVIILMIRPYGLFGTEKIERV